MKGAWGKQGKATAAQRDDETIAFTSRDRFQVFLVETRGSPDPHDDGSVPSDRVLANLPKVVVNLVNQRTGVVWKPPHEQEVRRLPLVRYSWAPAVDSSGRRRGGRRQRAPFVKSSFDTSLCLATTRLDKEFHMSANAAALVIAYLSRDYPRWMAKWGDDYILHRNKHGGKR